jgi:hypothetical protein
MQTKRKSPIKDPRIDDNFDGNDDHIDALRDLLNEYLKLHDELSELIEDGGMKSVEEESPRTYRRIVDTLAKLANRTDPVND